MEISVLQQATHKVYCYLHVEEEYYFGQPTRLITCRASQMKVQHDEAFKKHAD